MKRILTLLILTLAATSAAEGVHAQGLQSLLNLFANTKAAKADAHAAGEPLTLEQLTASTWVYSSPQMLTVTRFSIVCSPFSSPGADVIIQFLV